MPTAKIPAPGPTSISVEDAYARALDEIWGLRQAAAYEADILASHLELAGFPKARRGAAGEQVRRMRAAARGPVSAAYHVPAAAYYRAMDNAGAAATLTRARFEQECIVPSE
jgi:plasmid stabilization system protein ParE